MATFGPCERFDLDHPVRGHRTVVQERRSGVHVHPYSATNHQTRVEAVVDRLAGNVWAEVGTLGEQVPFQSLDGVRDAVVVLVDTGISGRVRVTGIERVRAIVDLVTVVDTVVVRVCVIGVRTRVIFFAVGEPVTV